MQQQQPTARHSSVISFAEAAGQSTYRVLYLIRGERVASEYNGREKEWRRIRVANVDIKVKVKLSGDITILFFNNRRMIIIVRSSAMINCDYPPATASRLKSKGG